MPEVVFCFDGDDAGRKAAFRGLEATLPAMQDGRQAKFLFLPEGEDPDTLVRAKGKAYLENLFDHADPLETFLFKHLEQGLDIESMDGRARFSKLAAPAPASTSRGRFQNPDVSSARRKNRHRCRQPQATAAAAAAAGLTSRSRSPPTMEAPPPIDPEEPPPEEMMPPEAPLSESLSPSSLNPVHRLLGLLVLKPSLVGHIPDTLLVTEGSRDALLLSEVVTHIRQYPEVTTAALLGFWFGTPEGDFLNALAGRETIEEED